VVASVVPDELFDAGLVELHEGDGTGMEGIQGGADESEHATGGAGNWAVLTPRGRLLANEVTVRLRL
jgi:hypothetical protein